ncbi:MAG: hypothetical protein KGJ06_05495, partial [Pseudomonadota bacterium]|nr:hypothetical protein [Pseudomonadota bacterium]
GITNAYRANPSGRGFVPVEIFSPVFATGGHASGEFLHRISVNYDLLKQVAEGKIRLMEDMSQEERKAVRLGQSLQENKPKRARG